MIRAIIFDFGNVICSFDVQRFLKNLLPFTPLSFAELQATLPELSSFERSYESGRITSDEFLRQVTGCCRLKTSREQFIHAYVDIFTPIPDTIHLVRALKPHYQLGLLSNTNEWHFEYGIRPVDVYPLFDSVSLSFHVGVMKPAKEIYLDAMTKLQLPAADCIYVDDLEENVRAATELGMNGIRYTSHENLLRELQAAGIMAA